MILGGPVMPLSEGAEMGQEMSYISSFQPTALGNAHEDVRYTDSDEDDDEEGVGNRTVRLDILDGAMGGAVNIIHLDLT